MAEETTSETQAVEAVQPQAGNDTNQPQQPQAGQTAPQADAHDVKSLPAWAQTLIGKVRAEAATYRKNATDFEKAQQAAEEQRLREQNQWQKLAETYKADLDRITAERDAEHRKTLMAQAAVKHKLPAELAELLKGETEEELDAHAASLAKLIVPVAPNTETGRAGATGNGKALTLDDIKRRKMASNIYG
jgi:ATPase subunit of ABC transporter with duplicated ATPase domains